MNSEQAIKYFESYIKILQNDIRQINVPEHPEWKERDKRVLEIYKLALAALREKQERENPITKECKERKCENWNGSDCTLAAPDAGCPFVDGCAYCKSPYNYHTNIGLQKFRDGAVLAVHCGENQPFLHTSCNPNKGDATHYTMAHRINFCPMCGRKLDHEPKEASHAEL